MSILVILDHHAVPSPQDQQYLEKVEYQLVSWGEIYAPSTGFHPHHSPYARVVLERPPFRLVGITGSQTDSVQKLCLGFDAPSQSKVDGTLYGTFPREIAHEFSAFLSLVTRRRVFPVCLTRSNDWPVEEQKDFHEQSHCQEMQRPKELNPSFFYELLERLRTTDRKLAERFILALRLYHSGIRAMYTEPEFAYLLLVYSLESLASAVCQDYVPGDKEEYINQRYPGLKALCLADDVRIQLQAILLQKEQYLFRKVLEFVKGNIPESFWAEEEDDAKPDYLMSIIGRGPDGRGIEKYERSSKTIQEWEKIDKNTLEETMSAVYAARSKLIHNGVRFPSTIVIGHFSMIPAEAGQELTQQTITGKVPRVPPLLTFERLVSYTLVNYLSRSGKCLTNEVRTED